jgi:hypothetical protein
MNNYGGAGWLNSFSKDYLLFRTNKIYELVLLYTVVCEFVLNQKSELYIKQKMHWIQFTSMLGGALIGHSVWCLLPEFNLD